MAKQPQQDEHRTEALGEPLAPMPPASRRVGHNGLPPAFKFAFAILFACGMGIAASPWWAPRLDAWFEGRAVQTSTPSIPAYFHCSRSERFGDTFQVHILDRKTMLVLHCRDAGKAGA